MNDSTTKNRKPRPRPARSAHVIIAPDGAAPAAVELTVGLNVNAYLIVAIPADFGRSFHVEKLSDGTVYQVNIDGTHRLCDCRGFLQHHHCKHADGIAALVAAGKL
jgi:hypothetical protein